MAACGSLENLGVGKCPLDFTAIKRFILVPITDSAGDKNSLDAADALTKAAWQAKFDAANALDRFYPTPKGRNITAETADPQVESFDDGASVFLSDGPITITALFPLVNFRLREALNAFRGREIGVIFIDQAGNIAYNNADGDGTVYPFSIDKDALLNSKAHLPTDGSSAKVDLTFQLERSIDFSDFGIIKRSDLDFNPLGSDVYALDDVKVTISGEATTGFTFKVEDMSGAPVEGMLAANVVIYNQTASAVITPTSVTEQDASTGEVGTYDVVFVAISGGATLTLTLNYSGYDRKVTTVTIPS